MCYSSFKLFNLQGSLFSNLRTVMEKGHKKVNLDPKTLTQIKQKSEILELRSKKNKKFRPKKLRSKNA